MSCVHYKFSSTLALYTVTFDGRSISLSDLRRQIMDRWRLKACRWQLQVTDAQSGEEYTDDEALIPTLSSVIIRRVPNVDGSGTAMGKSSRQTQNGVATAKRVRTCKGIPRSFMVTVEAGTKGAMITSTGEYVIPAIDAQAYAKGKKERPPFVPYVQPSSEEKSVQIPVDLLCPICKDLMIDAAIIPCCENSYCDECIRDALLDSEEHMCFTCKKLDVSPDSITANKALRQAVENFKNGRGNHVPHTSTSVPPSTPEALVQPPAPPATAAVEGQDASLVPPPVLDQHSPKQSISPIEPPPSGSSTSSPLLVAPPPTPVPLMFTPPFLHPPPPHLYPPPYTTGPIPFPPPAFSFQPRPVYTPAPPLLKPPWVAPGTQPPLVPPPSALHQPSLSKEDIYRQRQDNCSSIGRSHSRSRSRSNPRLSRSRSRPHIHEQSYPRSPYSRSNGPSRTRSPSPSRSDGHLCSGSQRSPPSYRRGAWERAGGAGPYRSGSRARSPSLYRSRSPVQKPPQWEQGQYKPLETLKTRTGDAPNSRSPKKEKGKSSGMRPPMLRTPPLTQNTSSHHPSGHDGHQPRDRDRGMASDRERDRVSDRERDRVSDRERDRLSGTRKAEVTVERDAARERSVRTERKERYQPSAGEWQAIRRDQAHILSREGRRQKGRLNLTALYRD